MGTLFSSLQRVTWNPENGLDFSETLPDAFRENLFQNSAKSRNPAGSSRRRKSGRGAGFLQSVLQDQIVQADLRASHQQVLGKSHKKPTSNASRLPTLVTKQKRGSLCPDPTENFNEAECSAEGGGPRVFTNKSTGSVSRKSDMINCNTEKTYRHEPWPTREVIREHLSKLDGVPTTIILARFVPRNSPGRFVEIKYSTDKAADRYVFETSDRLDILIPPKEGFPMGESQEEQVEYFFRIFKTCVNLLAGQVWWNGYSLVLDQSSTKNRLKMSAFEMDPSQLLFELTSLKDLEIHRGCYKVELRGKVESPGHQHQQHDEEVKTFKIRGPNPKLIKVSKLRGSLITVHLPEFTPDVLRM